MKKLLSSGILLLIFVIAIPYAVQSQATITPTSEAAVEVAPQMESAPTDCGPAPEPIAVSEHYAPVLGTWPIWGTLSSGGTEPEGILAMPIERREFSQLKGWWAQKVLWLVNTNYVGEVHLHGTNVADGSPIYFTFGESTPTTTPIFNPEMPGAFAPGSQYFANFPSLVWVSKAGCYLIEAQWDGGLWQQTIAVGYVEGSSF